VDKQNPFTIPVTPEVIRAARQGEYSVLLTETIPVPRDWFPPFKGLDLLGLACGGGQQGPVFAALGANVTIFDNSPPNWNTTDGGRARKAVHPHRRGRHA